MYLRFDIVRNILHAWGSVESLVSSWGPRYQRNAGVIVDCLFGWAGAKQNDEMEERHNLRRRQQEQSALADSVAHSGREYCQTAIYGIQSEQTRRVSEGGRVCREGDVVSCLPALGQIGKARIWTAQREGTPAAPVTDRPTLLIC